MSARFQVRELEGYAIHPDSVQAGGAALVAEVMVLDTWYCWHLVRSWTTAGKRGDSRPFARKRDLIRAHASEYAAQLNRSA